MHRRDDAVRIAKLAHCAAATIFAPLFHVVSVRRVSASWTRARIKLTLIRACWGMAMTVATGFSVLFVVAIPIAIVAASLGLIALALVKDSFQRRKNPA
jgi:hypothetical protein